MARRAASNSGQEILLKIQQGPIRLGWLARIAALEPRRFVDEQVRGPFARWRHEHRFEPEGDGSTCRLVDAIEFALPLGPLGRLFGGALIRSKLERMFTYRHAITRHDLGILADHPDTRPMRILVSGSTGLVGQPLVSFLTAAGHEVVRLVRSTPKGDGEIYWDPAAGTIDGAALEGFDGVVHLAGENIAAGRWTAKQKARIRDSRVDGTGLLAKALAACSSKPVFFVQASAVGWYGNRGDEVLTENSQGTGFLPDTCCQAWEAAAQPLRDAGVRTVALRLGVVLSARGGALAKMLLPFQLAGGVIGSGKQWMSWVALDDVVAAFHHALVTESLEGPANLVAPAAATNREYTKALGRVLKRPTIAPLPGFVAKIVFGEMAEDLLLGGQRVRPDALLDSGFRFTARRSRAPCATLWAASCRRRWEPTPERRGPAADRARSVAGLDRRAGAGRNLLVPAREPRPLRRGHARARYLTDTLAHHAELVTVCPEVEMGMPTPRPSVRIVEEPAGTDRLVDPKSGEDWTVRAEEHARSRVAALAEEPLDGFVLKKDSPSCGMERVKAWMGDGRSRGKKAVGFFARALPRRSPTCPWRRTVV